MLRPTVIATVRDFKKIIEMTIEHDTLASVGLDEKRKDKIKEKVILAFKELGVDYRIHYYPDPPTEYIPEPQTGSLVFGASWIYERMWRRQYYGQETEE